MLSSAGADPPLGPRGPDHSPLSLKVIFFKEILEAYEKKSIFKGKCDHFLIYKPTKKIEIENKEIKNIEKNKAG